MIIITITAIISFSSLAKSEWMCVFLRRRPKIIMSILMYVNEEEYDFLTAETSMRE